MTASKITNMDRSACRTVQEAAEAALKQVAEQFGMTLKTSGGKFDNASFTPKFTFVCIAADGIPADFTRWCNLFGMTAADFGKSFRRVNGDVVKITGIAPTRRRFPIMVEVLRTGKSILLTQEEVNRTLKGPTV